MNDLSSLSKVTQLSQQTTGIKKWSVTWSLCVWDTLIDPTQYLNFKHQTFEPPVSIQIDFVFVRYLFAVFNLLIPLLIVSLIRLSVMWTR